MKKEEKRLYNGNRQGLQTLLPGRAPAIIDTSFAAKLKQRVKCSPDMKMGEDFNTSFGTARTQSSFHASMRVTRSQIKNKRPTSIRPTFRSRDCKIN